MLIELSCEKFVDDGAVRAPVKFGSGLNVVLGDEKATNSIGKSTFLLVLDFVFGGNDYVERAEDVRRHVGEHTIKFCFEFEKVRYYFARSTVDNQRVLVLDKEGHERDSWSITKYREFLKEKYLIGQEDFSFRDAVSRYFRIYQRENLDERNPLSLYKEESQRKAIHALMQLFDCYAELQELADSADSAKERYQLYRNSVAQNFIPSISSKRECRECERQLEVLRAEQSDFDDPEKLKGKTAEELIRVAALKNTIQTLRAQRSRAETKLSRIEAGLTGELPAFTNEFDELSEFFPSVDIKKISEIEEFHRKLSVILKDELEAEQKVARSKIKELEGQIKQISAELESMDVPSGLSPRILKNYAERDREIKTLETKRENFKRELDLKDSRDALRRQLEEREQAVRDKIQCAISDAMKEKNDFIYEGKRKPPFLVLEKAGYRFATPDDTGTGTAYKSLVVYDLAVLELTNLPVLIHDSVIFKNIGDAPLEKILELYVKAGKQIFIALDKAGSYSAEASAILNDCARLRLSGGEHSLFGKSWGEKDAVVTSLP